MYPLYINDGGEAVLVTRDTTTLVVGLPGTACDYEVNVNAAQTAINNALSALPATGGEVLLNWNQAVTITGPITINKQNVHLRGLGFTTEIKRGYTTTADTSGMIEIRNSRASVRHLTLNGNKASYSGTYCHGFWGNILGNTSVIQSCQLKDISGIAFSVYSCANLTIRDCKVMGSTDGILSASNVHVLDNEIRVTGQVIKIGTGESSEGSLVQGNTLVTTGAVAVYPGSFSQILNNDIRAGNTAVKLVTGSKETIVQGNICRAPGYGIQCVGESFHFSNNLIIIATGGYAGIQLDTTAKYGMVANNFVRGITTALTGNGTSVTRTNNIAVA